MNPNSDQIVQDIRAHVESLLTEVMSPQVQTMSAEAMERRLLRQMLALGRLVLHLFLVWRVQTMPQQPVVTGDGQRLAAYGQRRRSYRSIFGRIVVWRPYFYRAGVGGRTPVDAALNLPTTSWSDVVREHVAALVVQMPYHKAAGTMRQFFGLHLSTHTIHDFIAADATDVPAYYMQRPLPPPSATATILVVQADGKGVPMRRAAPQASKARLGKGEKPTRKKEAIVTAIYTTAPRVRTPQQVVESLFHRPAPQERGAASATGAATRPQDKRVWVTLGGKDAALQELATQLQRRDCSTIQHRVALTDGSEALQQRMQQYCPTCTLVLDFIHADEYLWQAANVVLGETHPQRTAWVAARALQVLLGQVEHVISEFEHLAQAPDGAAAQGKVLAHVAAYFARNRAYMHYDAYLARGWPIATGVIEGACRHLVKDRCELAGMRWSQAGAEALLYLRCVYENGDWEAYHTFRRQQRQQRLYGAATAMEVTSMEAHILMFPEPRFLARVA